MRMRGVVVARVRTGIVTCVAALAAVAVGAVPAGKGGRIRLVFSSTASGYRASPNRATSEGTVVQILVHVKPSWATVVFAVFIMFVMWALALGAVSVAVNLIRRRRKFEG